MVWIIIVSLIFVSCSASTIWLLYSKVTARKALLMQNLVTLEEEMKTKQGILTELATLTLGLAPAVLIERGKAVIAQKEEELRAERGRMTITQAELEAVDVRLRELEEIERELENSGIEAAKELEMLRIQEHEIGEKNAQLKVQLESAFFQLDLLLAQLSHSQQTVESLNKLKTEILESQEKNEYYEEQISAINHTYMELKRAYDALDIEYAQLYEKQSIG